MGQKGNLVTPARCFSQRGISRKWEELFLTSQGRGERTEKQPLQLLRHVRDGRAVQRAVNVMAKKNTIISPICSVQRHVVALGSLE